jgi:putative molybdopterin biosynthesis protein
VAALYDLGFVPIGPEHYDFLVQEERWARPPVQAFVAALKDPTVRERIRRLGMEPAE